MNRNKRTSNVMLQMLLGLAAAALAGFLLNGFWELFGLPDRPATDYWRELARPWGLGLFVSLALPAAAFLPTLVLGIMTLLLPADAGPELREHCRQAQRYDAYTYLLLGVGLVLVLAWNVLGNGFLALGLCFLGLVTVKALILMRLLWLVFLDPAARPEGGLGRRRQTAVFLVALVIFALPTAWLCQSVSSGRVEAVYLIGAHAVVEGQPAAAEPGPQHRGFYWSQPQAEISRLPQGPQARIFAAALAPPYAAAGRLGVLVLQAVVMALLAVQLLAWLSGAGVRPGPAATATGLAMTSAPVFFAAGQALPEAAAMLFTVLALRLLASQDRQPLRALALLGLICLALAMLQMRYLPLAAAFLALGVFEALRLKAGSWWAWLGLAAGGGALLGLMLYFPLSAWPLGLGQRLLVHLTWWQEALHWWTPLGVFLAGLTLDQSHGFVLSAPIFLLALGGLPASLRRRPRPSLHLLLPGLAYLASACFIGWYRLPGELSSPARLLVVLLPATALFMAPPLAALLRPWWRLAVWVPAALGLAYTWLLTLLPWLRFGRPGEINPLADALGKKLDLELGLMLPSGIIPSPVLLVALGLTGLALIFYLAAGLKAPATVTGRWRANEALALALGLGLLAWALVAATAFNAP
jgi:hypothetical protein